MIDVLSRLDSPRQTGQDRWQCRCPAHDDGTASLSVSKTNGRWLFHCHAGCDTESVLAKLNLRFSDISGERMMQEQTIEYKYVDANGNHVYSALRLPGKQFRQRQASGEWSMTNVERVPYNLPEVLKSDTVFIVEGEKDCETLKRCGLVATTNVGGAGKWQASFSKYFEGRTVYVLPDNDQAGSDHAKDVLAKLGHGTIIEIPGLPPKGDVSDWFRDGGNREKLEQLVSDKTKPQASKSNELDPPTTPASRLLVQYLQRINAGELQQLTKQYSALAGIEIGPGLLTVIGAPPGQGKTGLAMQVMFDALELDQELSAVVANAETTFDNLLRRELTRITRIKSDDIRFGNLTDHGLEKINEAANELIPRMQRVRVLNDPNTLSQLLRLRNDPPGMVIVDYLQKFAPPDRDARQGVGDVMAGLRMLAKLGWTVVCLSATARGKDGKHDSKQLNLSSFRESGEIEYNADSAYLLLDNGPIDEQQPYILHITLQHVKNRHGAKVDKQLMFHMPRMSFEALPTAEPVAVGDDDDFAPWRGN